MPPLDLRVASAEEGGKECDADIDGAELLAEESVYRKFCLGVRLGRLPAVSVELAVGSVSISKTIISG